MVAGSNNSGNEAGVVAPVAITIDPERQAAAEQIFIQMIQRSKCHLLFLGNIEFVFFEIVSE